MMKYDCLLVGVGGQGVLSVAAVIAHSAAKINYSVRQSEVHGMAQRGGAVLAHLRLAGPGETIAGDLVPKGAADIIISMEPLESLRYLAWLSPGGMVVSSADSLINIPNYPEKEELEKAVKSLPKSAYIPAGELAREAGLARTVNIVMVGAASPFLPIPEDVLENTIVGMFTAKGRELAEFNKKAFQLGRSLSLDNIRQ